MEGERMMVELSDGGRLELQSDGSIVRLDNRNRPVETVKPGDSLYGYWIGLVEMYGKRPPSERNKQRQEGDSTPDPGVAHTSLGRTQT
jgi:hypothetical protein